MAKRSPRISITRAYAAAKAAAAGEYRVLVDRLWPRGVSKDSLHLDEWRKEIAPTAELRRWFGHREDRWDEFRIRYAAELAEKKDDLKELRSLPAKHHLVLLYGARDEEHNNAVVLRDVLLRRRIRKST
ncbi:DUF488 domain-containing protein [Planctomyces sp. SH-PL14]|uniref:DUF488 domain-containing protein n=1 Tax=Planctomyces sp. SH-PL14 TaxID=1632864 RepID=UPI00078B4D9F|nr:DUF488 family protein [Planctomyces sp. SH-PL14]AMV20638.1 hypothetical protein VT03_22250 [Planctomyces sp. SH-PL14]